MPHVRICRWPVSLIQSTWDIWLRVLRRNLVEVIDWRGLNAIRHCRPVLFFNALYRWFTLSHWRPVRHLCKLMLVFHQCCRIVSDISKNASIRLHLVTLGIASQMIRAALLLILMHYSWIKRLIGEVLRHLIISVHLVTIHFWCVRIDEIISLLTLLLFQLIPFVVIHRQLRKPTILNAHLIDFVEFVNLLNLSFLRKLKSAGLRLKGNRLDRTYGRFHRHLGACSSRLIIRDSRLLLSQNPESFLVRRVQRWRRHYILVSTSLFIFVFTISFPHLFQQKLACWRNLSEIST